MRLLRRRQDERITLSKETSAILQEIADKEGFDPDQLVRLWCEASKIWSGETGGGA